MNSSPLALAELLLKGTAVLLLGYVGALLLARASAAQRSLCWLGVFASMLCLPLALVVRPAWSLPVRTMAPPVVAPANLAQVPAVALAEANTVSSPQLAVERWLSLLYGCGVAAVVGFRLLGEAQVWKLRRVAVPHAGGQAIADGWGENRVRVCVSPRVSVPMTCGTWRPVILLPVAPLGGAELHAALRHELAHICHADAARRWLGTIAVALWWPHPLVWLAFRSWKLEQERACDDAVLNGGADAAEYAQQLLDAARGVRLPLLQSAGALVMAMPAGLETRMRSVTNRQVNRAPARWRSSIFMGALALAITLSGLAFQAQSVTPAPPATPDAGTIEAVKKLQEKAETTVIPEISAREITVDGLLRLISGETGIALVYQPKEENEARITLHLKNVPASEAIRYAAALANLSYTYRKDGVYFEDLPPAAVPPAGAARPLETLPSLENLKPVAPLLPGVIGGEVGTAASLVTREWKIPANFPATLAKSEKPQSAREELEAAGIVFPPGSSAIYLADRSRLIVRNTRAQLDRVDALVELSAKKAAR